MIENLSTSNMPSPKPRIILDDDAKEAHDFGDFICLNCEQQFSNQSLLEKHEKQVHGYSSSFAISVVNQPRKLDIPSPDHLQDIKEDAEIVDSAAALANEQSLGKDTSVPIEVKPDPTDVLKITKVTSYANSVSPLLTVMSQESNDRNDVVTSEPMQHSAVLEAHASHLPNHGQRIYSQKLETQTATPNKSTDGYKIIQIPISNSITTYSYTSGDDISNGGSNATVKIETKNYGFTTDEMPRVDHKPTPTYSPIDCTPVAVPGAVKIESIKEAGSVSDAMLATASAAMKTEPLEDSVAPGAHKDMIGPNACDSGIIVKLETDTTHLDRTSAVTLESDAETEVKPPKAQTFSSPAPAKIGAVSMVGGYGMHFNFVSPSGSECWENDGKPKLIARCFYPGCGEILGPVTSRRLQYLKHRWAHKPLPICPMEGCGMYFADDSFRKKHMKDYHGVSNPAAKSLYARICPLCGVVLNVGYQIHRLACLGYVRLACTYPGCVEVFLDILQGWEHIKCTHENVPLFVCRISGCEKRFCQREDLISHYNNKHSRADCSPHPVSLHCSADMHDDINTTETNDKLQPGMKNIDDNSGDLSPRKKVKFDKDNVVTSSKPRLFADESKQMVDSESKCTQFGLQFPSAVSQSPNLPPSIPSAHLEDTLDSKDHVHTESGGSISKAVRKDLTKSPTLAYGVTQDNADNPGSSTDVANSVFIVKTEPEDSVSKSPYDEATGEDLPVLAQCFHAECGLQFPFRSPEYRQHRWAHPPPFTCPICSCGECLPVGFDELIKKHMLDCHHIEKPERWLLHGYACWRCGTVIEDFKVLLCHEKSCLGFIKLSCNYPGCSKLSFMNENNIMEHISIFHGKRNSNFECQFKGCGKQFYSSLALNNHLNIHTGDRPYHCTHQGCKKAYKQRSHLRYHLLNHDENMKKLCPGPHACSYEGCGKTFYSSQNLKNHMNVHTGDRPYCCAYEGCKKAYKQKAHLQYHLQNHGKVPQKTQGSQCPFCHKIYKARGSVIQHIRYSCKFNPSPFGKDQCICIWCGKEFKHAKLCSQHHLFCTKQLTIDLEPDTQVHDV